MKKPLINDTFLLEKIPGKGGWTYTLLPGIPDSLRSKGGLVKVRGFVDDIEIKSYHLFPIKAKPGTYFFPVKAEIRKKIKKQKGDHVHIVLYADTEPVIIPEEIILCLQDDPKAFKFFKTLNENEQQNYIKWIYAAKTDETRIDRIAKTVDKLSKHQKFQ
jgi:hypothetical protein